MLFHTFQRKLKSVPFNKSLTKRYFKKKFKWRIKRRLNLQQIENNNEYFYTWHDTRIKLGFSKFRHSGSPSPWYFRNSDIHGDLAFPTIQIFLHNLAIKFHKKLNNELILALTDYDTDEAANKKRPMSILAREF
jgi:hypothetical protein